MKQNIPICYAAAIQRSRTNNRHHFLPEEAGAGLEPSQFRQVSFKKPSDSPHSKGVAAEVMETMLYLSSAISYL